MANNKITYFGTVLIDLTADDVTTSDVVNGKQFHDRSGAILTGTLDIQHYYTGSTAPSSSLGENGDIYLRTA